MVYDGGRASIQWQGTPPLSFLYNIEEGTNYKMAARNPYALTAGRMVLDST